VKAIKKLKKGIKVLFVLCCCLLFSGCWDKFEPEERGFVTAMGIDKNENMNFNISVEVPETNLFQDGGGEGGGGEKESEEPVNSYVQSSSDDSVWGAVKAIDGKTDRKLDFGQIKLCVFGEEILKDERMFKQAIDAIERNKDIWRKVLICAAKGSAEDVLKGYTGDRKAAGFFVTGFFNNNKKSTDLTFKKDLHHVLSELDSSKTTVMPVIEVNDGEISFSGMSVIRDYSFVGYGENEIVKGYNIILEDIMETDITVDFNGISVPLKVTKKNTDIKFSEENNMVKCSINVDIEGGVEEYDKSPVPVSELEKVYKSKVEEYIRNSFNFFKNDLKTDVLLLGEQCRKKNNDLYKKFEGKIFDNIELSENANVSIKGTGTIS